MTRNSDSTLTESRKETGLTKEKITALEWLISERFKVQETDNVKFSQCIDLLNFLKSELPNPRL